MREIGDGRGGDDAGAFDFRSASAQAGGEQGGDPGAGLAGVAAEDDAGSDETRLERARTQLVGKRQADGIDRPDIEWCRARDAADAVGAEKLSHGVVDLSFLGLFFA